MAAREACGWARGKYENKNNEAGAGNKGHARLKTPAELTTIRYLAKARAKQGTREIDAANSEAGKTSIEMGRCIARALI